MSEASSSTFPDTPASPAPEEGVGGGSGNFNSTTKSIAELAEDVQRTVMESRDSAVRSARSLQENSTTHLRSLKDFARCVQSHYHTYDDAAMNKVKVGFKNAREDPEAAFGWCLVAGLLLLPAPRRFLFRKIVSTLRSEEAKFSRAEKSVTDLSISVDVMKNESKKLLERTNLAEKDMKHGLTNLSATGSQIQRLAKSVYKVETRAADLMDDLREIPNRDALKLRAEVANMVSALKQQRLSMEKRIFKISELGVSI